jgi:hypothetical protein
VEIGDLLGDGTAIVMWRDKFAVRIRAFDGEMERKSQRVLKPQWSAHQKLDDKVDHVALRDFYCQEIIVDVDGLTKAGQPYGKTMEDKRELWDRTPDFRTFIIRCASEAGYFSEEKKV